MEKHFLKFFGYLSAFITLCACLSLWAALILGCLYLTKVIP